MAARQIALGVGGAQFAPEQKVTRAEFAALLVRALGLKAAGAAPFADVDASKWYAGPIAAALEAGIVSGITGSEFAPDAEINREEMAVMVMRALALRTGESASGTGPAEFADRNEIGGWARDAVDAAFGKGILKGLGDGRFAPKAPTSRAKSIQAVAALLEHDAKEPGIASV